MNIFKYLRIFNYNLFREYIFFLLFIKRSRLKVKFLLKIIKNKHNLSIELIIKGELLY